MKAYGKFVIVPESSGFPSQPEDGQIAFQNNKLYVAATIESVKTWIPIASGIDTFSYTNGTASTSWVINHGLGTSEIVIQCYDLLEELIIPDVIDITDDNNVTVTFASNQDGRATLIAGTVSGITA